MENLDAYTEEWHDLKITGKHVKLLDLVQVLETPFIDVFHI